MSSVRNKVHDMSFLDYFFRGIGDLTYSFKNHPLWLYFGWRDIKSRYKRSVLGPWWLVLSNAVSIGSLGLLWSQILHVSAMDMLVYFSIGLTLWGLITSVICDCCDVYPTFQGHLKQGTPGYFIFPLRIVARNTVVFLHNMVVVCVVVFLFGRIPSLFELLEVFFALLIIVATISFMGTMTALLCIRFRDIKQIVYNVMQLLFFVTPIIWMREGVKNYQFIAEINPFSSLVMIFRNPLLGKAVETHDIVVSIALLLVTAVAAAFAMGKYSRKIIYWL